MSNKEEKVENINAKENLLEEDALTSKVDDDSSSSSDDAKSEVIEVQHKSLKTVQIVGVISKPFFFLILNKIISKEIYVNNIFCFNYLFFPSRSKAEPRGGRGMICPSHF